jgi:hypothetical protein
MYTDAVYLGARAFYACSSLAKQELNEATQELEWKKNWYTTQVHDSKKFVARLKKIGTRLKKSWYLTQEAFTTEAVCAQAGGVWEKIQNWPDDNNAALWRDGPRYIVSACGKTGSAEFVAGCRPGIVSLDLDSDSGYGPAGVTFQGMLPDGEYRVYILLSRFCTTVYMVYVGMCMCVSGVTFHPTVPAYVRIY